MRILLVTEKYNPDETQRDGGARLVATLKKSFGNKLEIMQFDGEKKYLNDGWSFKYPINPVNRFERRIANADFIAKQINFVAHNFTHIIFVHISMQFGYLKQHNIETWTFPMFLTPSYQSSGEEVPIEYTKMEKNALSRTKNIITPSYFEKEQLINYYNISKDKIHVLPRGVVRSIFKPTIRNLNENLVFCSIGSIKPQKNTLELLDLFAQLKQKYPKSFLRLIGPVQDKLYYQQVTDKIKKLGIHQNIELIGYVPPNKLSKTIADCHIHISTSNCETFGRSIFETLASSIPNVARIKNNAAYDFLQNLPYIKFVSTNKEALKAIDEIISNFSKLSSMASEIGYLYDDKRLARLIIAKICNNDNLIISDYDGTLFHKECHHKTINSIKKFKQISPRIICSARSTKDLLIETRRYNLEVDWIISYSGAVITDGKGNLLFINSLSKEEIKKIICKITEVKNNTTDESILQNSLLYNKIVIDNKVIQISTTSKINTFFPEFNIETYQRKNFISKWESSKLRAICKLLDYINWQGNVIALGDGKYDLEYLKYFDGCLVT